MNEEELKSIVRNAEPPQSPGKAFPGLAQRVRDLDRQRRRRARVVLAATPLAALCAIVAIWLLRPDAVPPNSDKRLASVPLLPAHLHNPISLSLPPILWLTCLSKSTWWLTA